MSRILSATALLLCLSFSPLQAQQSSAEADALKMPEQPAETQTDEKKAAARTAQTEAADFKPSEEISEDLSVAFPVDI